MIVNVNISLATVFYSPIVRSMKGPTSFKELKQWHDSYHTNTAAHRMAESNHPLWGVLSMIHTLQARIGEALLQTPHQFSLWCKKHWGKSITTGALLAYMFSPQIGYDKNQGSWVGADQTLLSQGVDSLYVTTDGETNIIVKLVSGIASKAELDSLKHIYGHHEAFDTMYANTPADPVLYKCLGIVLMSIHNPHMSFAGDYKRDILGDALGYDNSNVSAKVDEFSASMQIANIKKNGVFGDTADYVRKQDSTLQSQGKQPRKDEDIQQYIHQCNKQGAKYILNKIFAEAGHIRGIHKEGVVRYYINYLGDYIKSGGSQKALYDQEGSQEYITHTVDNGRAKGDEGILIAQLLKLYEKHMPQNSIWHVERLITMYDGYFENYTDQKKASLYKEKVAVLQWKQKQQKK